MKNTLYRQASPSGSFLPNWFCFLRFTDDSGNVRTIQHNTGARKKEDATRIAQQLERDTLKQYKLKTQQEEPSLRD